MNLNTSLDSIRTPSPVTIDSTSSSGSTTPINPEPKTETGSFEGHEIALTTPTAKKRVTWNTITYFSYPAEERTMKALPLQNIRAATPSEIALSRKIEKWASQLKTNRAGELKQVEDALAYLDKHPNALNEKTKGSLKNWLPIIQRQVSSAKKYALWTNARTQLLLGSKNFTNFLKRSGKSIDKKWSLKELNEDWDIVKDESWANEDPQHDAIKKIVFQLFNQAERVQKEIDEAKQKILSLAKDVNKLETRQKPVTTTPSTQLNDSENLNSPDDSDRLDVAPWYARHPLDSEGNFNTKITLDMHGDPMESRYKS